MTTSARIIDTLKRQLKLRGMTYKALAERLELSESAVKHMFSTGNFSLRRLDDVCAILELDIGDLVDISESQEQKIEQLSDDNERAIVADVRLLLVTYCLINYWTFDEVIERYDISPTEGLKYLRQLDRMKVIELQPGDRVRLLIANNFSWRQNGAIEKFFRSVGGIYACRPRSGNSWGRRVTGRSPERGNRRGGVCALFRTVKSRRKVVRGRRRTRPRTADSHWY